MSDEQLQRDVADIRVLSAEIVQRVRTVERDVKSQSRRIDAIGKRVTAGDRWRYTVIGGMVASVFVLNVGISWAMR